MIQRQNKERTTASHLCYYGNELRVDSAEIGIVRIPCDLYVIIATLSFERHAVHMAEFRASHATEPYLKNVFQCEL